MWVGVEDLRHMGTRRSERLAEMAFVFFFLSLCINSLSTSASFACFFMVLQKLVGFSPILFCAMY